MTSTGDHGRLLGVSPEADKEEIRAAYRAKLRLWHPDLFAGEPEPIRQAATDMTARLNRAYEHLSDSTRRTNVHDRSYRDTRSTPPPSTSPSPREGERRSPRIRDLTTIGLGGIGAPLIGLLWASGLVTASPPANAPVVVLVCAAVIAATMALLVSSDFLDRRDRLGQVGVFWSRLMRLMGWTSIGALTVLLGIPALVLVVMTVVAAPFFGLVLIALISGRSTPKRDRPGRR